MFEPKDVHYTRRVIIAISICLTLFGLAPATQADAYPAEQAEIVGDETVYARPDEPERS